MVKEFKEFVMRGNVLDLAVAVIIGGAFGKIITSLVNDVIMPPIGLLLGKMDFSSLFLNLSGTAYSTLSEAKKAGAPTINYGLFINSVIDFVIVAFVIFLIIRSFLRLQALKQAPAPTAEPTTKECPFCFTTINIKAVRCPNCTSELR